MKLRYALAYAALALLTVGSAAAMFLVVQSRPGEAVARPEAAYHDSRTLAPRLAAQAFLGAVNNSDPIAFCSLLAAPALEGSGLGPTREDCARNPGTATALANLQAVTAILFVKRTSPTQARIRVSVDGNHYFFFFIRESDGRWRFGFAQNLSGSGGAAPSG